MYMECYINQDIKKGSIVYTIENCKIEQYFVEVIFLNIDTDNDVLRRDISNYVHLQLERHNDGINSYKTIKPLSQCFLNKEDLINQL